jgi:hypothetical protein
MPHPTPVQIAYGSATVISTTLLLMLIAPTGSTLVVALIAVVSLMLGVVVAIAVQSRRGVRAQLGGAAPAVPPARTREAPAAAPAHVPTHVPAAAHLPPAERPEVRV